MTARPQPQPVPSGSLYERDIVAWSEQRASLLRTGRLTELDIANIAEETGIGFDTLPTDCPWTADQILDAGFWPGDA